MLKKLGWLIIALTIPVLYVTSGQLNSSVADLGKILVNLFHPTFELDSIVERVILLIRVPRALTAMICGAGLAACGCAVSLPESATLSVSALSVGAVSV